MLLPQLGSLVAGKYRLESLLGEGGMGAVFRARHEIMDKPVAVKWLKPSHGDEIAAKHRFVQEARAAARIRHPNVVDVYDVGAQDGCLFMVMELLEGETFADFLERPEFPIADAIRHLLGAMRGVAAAHAAGITHRDIKPENVFLAVDAHHVGPVAKILDFGISKLHDDPQAHVTLAGVAMGTPHYMSIEQIRGASDVDHRTDIYAFGVLLYRALTGVLPYDGETLPSIVFQAASGRAVPPVSLRPDLPRELDQLVLKAIALRREDRFQTMDELITALVGVQRMRRSWMTQPSRTFGSVSLPLPTPRPPTSDWTSSQAAASLKPKARGFPLNPWLGAIGVVLGLALGGTLYAKLITPTRPLHATPAVPAAGIGAVPTKAPVIRSEASLPSAPSTSAPRARAADRTSPIPPASTAVLPKAAFAESIPKPAPIVHAAAASKTLDLRAEALGATPSASESTANAAPLAKPKGALGARAVAGSSAPRQTESLVTRPVAQRIPATPSSSATPDRARAPTDSARIEPRASTDSARTEPRAPTDNSRAEPSAATNESVAGPAPTVAPRSHRSGELKREDL